MQNLKQPNLWTEVLIFYIVTSIGSLVLGIIQPMLGVPGVVIQLTQFGPTLGVLALCLLRSLMRMPSLATGNRFWPHQPWKLAAVAALSALIVAAAWAWYSLNGLPVAYTPPSSLSHPFWLIVIAQFIGAAGEEIGWRCFLQPMLQSRFGVLPASVIVGFLWGIWHIGIFAEGPGYALLFILFAVSISVILGELLRDASGGRLLISTTFHALINLGLLIWFNEEDGSRQAMGTLAVSCTLLAVIVIVAGRTVRKNIITS